MPLSSAAHFEKVITALSILRYMIKARTKLNRYDLNRDAEKFFKQILNLTFGWDLEVMQLLQKNYPSIDLGGVSSSVAVQVTAERSSTKIKKTVKSFLDQGLYKKYERLVFLILTDKRAYSANFATGALRFTACTDILDTDDLLAEIEKLEYHQLEAISDVVDSEIGTIIRSFADAGSVFARSEQRSGCAPMNGKLFLEFLEISEPADARDEFGSVCRCFDNLRSLPKDARGVLGVMVDRGRKNRDGHYGQTERLSVRAEALTSLTPHLKGRHVGLFKLLEDCDVASLEEDTRPETLTLHHTLPSGLDFFVLAKEFLNANPERIRRMFEECDFTCLDS